MHRMNVEWSRESWAFPKVMLDRNCVPSLKLCCWHFVQVVCSRFCFEREQEVNVASGGNFLFNFQHNYLNCSNGFKNMLPNMFHMLKSCYRNSLSIHLTASTSRLSAFPRWKSLSRVHLIKLTYSISSSAQAQPALNKHCTINTPLGRLKAFGKASNRLTHFN